MIWQIWKTIFTSALNCLRNCINILLVYNIRGNHGSTNREVTCLHKKQQKQNSETDPHTYDHLTYNKDSPEIHGLKHALFINDAESIVYLYGKQ